MDVLPYLVKAASVVMFIAVVLCLVGKTVREWFGWNPFGLAGPAGTGDRLPLTPAGTRVPSSEVWRGVIVLFAVTRAIVFIAGFAFAALIGEWKPSLYDTFVSYWREYDTYHYLSIAGTGYHADGDSAITIAFYPLYPALIRLVGFLVPDLFAAGLIVSNAFLLIGMYALVRLVELDAPGRTAFASAKLMMLYPLSFFFSIVYTESLFFALCVLSVYNARKRKWLLAGVFGMLAALTRNQGVLLAVPIAIELIETWREHRSSSGSDNGNAKKAPRARELASGAAAVLLPSFGIFLYLLVNKLATGDWFRFLFHQKEYWGQTFGFFADNLAVHMYRTLHENRPLFALGVWIPQMILFFAVHGLLIAMTNKTRLSYWAYSFVYLVVSYAPTGLLSGARYVGGMFTLYLFMALAASEWPARRKTFVDAGLVVLLLGYTLLFGLNYVF
ncbi:hypothetical protein [Paenibacillus flagellatus]|uniref:Glycosyltransferase RgtA/B/C/D-like domain-containing protein n=1 Tax=Paenibacillus flagellatus TaxID=2211139 RepID=A0A2V5K9L4_9BACL|nr:hypothetical protein [Paenibacillus flagellatus]PYI56235.1 hypothetical protein DLM86_04415 [Paenibacillus flagellatus]